MATTAPNAAVQVPEVLADLRLHRLLTVRVAGATPAASSRLARLLPGRWCEADGDRPDLLLRRVERLALAPGWGRMAGQVSFDDQVMVLQRHRCDGARRVAVTLDDVGSGCQVAAEGDLPDADLAVLLLRGAALGRQILPLHGAVFEHRGAGVVATGWPGSGKTAALLDFLAHGARPVASEWSLVTADGSGLRGLTHDLRLKPAHLHRLPPALGPRWARALARRARAHAVATGVAAGVAAAAGGGHAGRVTRALDRRAALDVPWSALAPPGTATTGFDALFLLEDAEVDGVVVQPLDPGTAAARLTRLLLADLAELTAAYGMFRYAFPHRASPVLDQAEERHRALLERHLGSRPVFLVRHRYPAPPGALFRAMAPVLA